MDTPFIGETRIFAFGFAPPGWQPCDGRLLPIGEFLDLFQLIGATYGGDGEKDFALPKAAGPVSGGKSLQPVHLPVRGAAAERVRICPGAGGAAGSSVMRPGRTRAREKEEWPCAS